MTDRHVKMSPIGESGYTDFSERKDTKPNVRPQPLAAFVPSDTADTKSLNAEMGASSYQHIDAMPPKARSRNLVRLRGLPYSAREPELRQFFGDLVSVINVYIINNNEGRPSGEAYVQLETNEDIQNALSKHQCMIGSRYIEVFPLGEIEIDQALQRMQQRNALSDYGCVRVRGLPFSCRKEDLHSFFQGLNINDIVFGKQPGEYGRPTGEAYIRFESKQDVQRALQFNGEYMGRRYVEIFQVDGDAFKFYQQRMSGAMSRPRTLAEVVDDPYSLYPTGGGMHTTGSARPPPPPSATAAAAANNAYSEYGYDRRAYDATAYDAGADYNSAAASYASASGAYSDHAYNQAASSRYAQAAAPAAYDADPYAASAYDYSAYGYDTVSGVSQGYPAATGGYDYDTTAQLYAQQQGPVPLAATAPRAYDYEYDYNYPAQGYGANGYSASSYGSSSYGTNGYGAQGNGRGGMSSGYGYGRGGRGAPRGGSRGGSRGGPRGGGGAGGPRMSASGERITPTKVHMRGLPYRVAPREIDEFFAPIPLVEVKVGTLQDGRASGDGIAEFGSVQDAQEALRRDRMMIRTRYIELFAHDMMKLPAGTLYRTISGGSRSAPVLPPHTANVPNAGGLQPQPLWAATAQY